jgi:signal transduction histidine kinase/ligand-binding sensor domain-containing protein
VLTPLKALCFLATCFLPPTLAAMVFRRTLVLLLVTSWALPFSAGAAPLELPHYFSRSWKTDNGLPDNAVTAVVQTRDGYLWLGTYGGVARFDGVSFTVFNTGNTPQLQSDRVTALFEDGQGTLWIGHERGDLTSCHDGVFMAADVHVTGVRRKINGIGSDAEGDIWMLNEEGTLVRARDSASYSLPNRDGMAMMAQNSAGKLWVASGGQVAAMIHGRLVSLMTTNDSSSNAFSGYVQGACASHDGGLWVVIDDRVKKWNGRCWTEDRGTNPCASNISAMSETASGTLALGTVDSGLYLLFPDRRVLHFSQAEGFPHDWIRCLFEDREGTVWTGAGSDGLVALRPGKVATLDPPDHWQGRVTLSVATARDGALWASTEGNGVYRFRNGAQEHFGESSGFSNEFVWCVSEDLKGRMWAGTWGGGMFVEEAGRFVFPPGLENVTVPMPAILHGADGVTWIGTASGLIRYDSGVVKWFGEADGLRSPDVRTIVQEQDGTVWFGMLGGGLGRLRNGSVKQFLKRDGLPNDYVQCLHFDAGGALWIGTYGGGLARFKDDHFAKITAAEGLPNNFICAIADDQRGNFWISSHDGIFRVSQKALADCAEGRAATVTCLAYGKGEGMPSLECSGGLQPATCTLADGRICFPTSKGVVLVNPDDIKINRRPPPVVIEEIVAGGRVFAEHPDGTATRKAPLKIPPGLQRFEFHYTGLSFVAPEKMQFQYRLEGWEKDWVDAANNKRVAEYSYIPPGSYTFQVRACNSDGVWNEEGASFGIMVLPHFWQTWWFHTLSVLAAIALVAGAVLFVTRRRMRLKLERIERQQALERERTRIAKDIHDHLGANLTRISLLSQSAHSELENPVHAAAQLNRIYDTSRELTRAMDEIVWAVNPQHDTLDSLASYLGNFAQEYLVSINIRCRLDMPLHLPPWPITAEVRHNVFLAFKEALHNVVKHAAATEVSVLLATTAHGFVLTVRDNGKGFAPANVTARPGRGNGLKNMGQRLEKSGGHCAILSTPGAGTEVQFTLAVSERVREII